MRPRSRLFALFPYTTLFRSGVGSAAVQMARATGARVLATAAAADARWVASLGAEHVLDYRDPDLTARLLEDRESTRLNSSHVAISYAVFCLKKKSKQIE